MSIDLLVCFYNKYQQKRDLCFVHKSLLMKRFRKPYLWGFPCVLTFIKYQHFELIYSVNSNYLIGFDSDTADTHEGSRSYQNSSRKMGEQRVSFINQLQGDELIILRKHLKKDPVAVP